MVNWNASCLCMKQTAFLNTDCHNTPYITINYATRYATVGEQTYSQQFLTMRENENAFVQASSLAHRHTQVGKDGTIFINDKHFGM